MQTNRIFRYRKKYLDSYVLGKGRLNPDDPSTYTYYHPILAKCWFSWQTLIFLIDNYYINQCFFWPTFRSFYNYVNTSLVSLNVIFMILLLLHLVYRILMTPTMPANNFEGLTKSQCIRLEIEHYLKYQLTGLYIAVYIVFLVSFFIPYDSAQYVHLIYLLRIAQMNKYMGLLYNKIHSYKFLRILYTLTVMFYLIIYFSHFLGCIFYIFDQKLIESQYFDDPNLYPERYYQYISMSFTPIEMLSQIDKYIMAFYFSSGLVTTIAYGDIVDAYVTVLMVASTIVVAFILQQFMIMVGDNRFAIFQIIKKYKHLKELMIQKKVPQELQIKIRNYLFYVQYYNKFHNPTQVFDKLSGKIQIDLYQNGYGPFFSDLLRPLGFTDIRSLCSALQQVTYQPQTQIFQSEWRGKSKDSCDQLLDEYDQQALNPNCICLVKGKMFQYLQYQMGSKQFQFRKNQRHFNVFQFLTKLKVRYGLRSKTIVHAIVLKKDIFMEKLNQNQTLKIQLSLHRQKVLANTHPKTLYQDNCQICDDFDHNVMNCPEIHYVIDGTIDKANKISTILGVRTNNRKQFNRQYKTTKRKVNLLHYRAMFGALNFNSFLPLMNDHSSKEMSFSFLQKSIQNMLQQVHADKHIRFQSDSCYDSQGAQKQWSLQH